MSFYHSSGKIAKSVVQSLSVDIAREDEQIFIPGLCVSGQEDRVEGEEICRQEKQKVSMLRHIRNSVTQLTFNISAEKHSFYAKKP